MPLNKKQKFSILATIIVTIGCIVFLILYHSPKQQLQPTNLEAKQTTTDETVTPSTPTITIKNITLKEQDKKKGYELTVVAKESVFLNNIESIDCKDVSCSITKKQQLKSYLQAKNARINRTTKEVFFAGPISGQLKDLSLFASDVSYNFATQVVTTTKSTVYQHPQFTLSAPSSNVDINKQIIYLKGGVRSEFFK